MTLGIVPVPIPLDEPFARIARVADDVVELHILRTAYVRWATNEGLLLSHFASNTEEGFARDLASAFTNAAEKEAWKRESNVSLAVPYELVRAAWVDGSGSDRRIHLILTADLVFTGSTWLLRPS